ncbi:putative holin, partial [Salmonella enterica subsp. enterica serovar Oslo]|uniref:putative holin n=1 Tax=Salmonella enterica TaxID=28901 RepID=UPI00288F4CC1
RLVAYFIKSFILGVLGAGLRGTKLSSITLFVKPLDSLGAVIISEMCFLFLTFLKSLSMNSLFIILSGIRGGGSIGSN